MEEGASAPFISMIADLTQPFLSGVEERKDNIIISHAQYVGDIYRANKESRNHSDEDWSRGKSMKLAARIPTLERAKLAALGLDKDLKTYLRAIECHPEWKTTRKRLI